MIIKRSIATNIFHVAITALLLAATSQSLAAGQPTAGWIEKAVLLPQDIMLHAKLDTGAKTSSINAPDPYYFERDGRQWVRFRITNRDIESVMIEAPVIRESNIKRHFGEKQTRPVIKLHICIGDVAKTIEVNLVDRTGLNYQLLVGRNYLENTYLIDSGSTYSLSPACDED
jgi:hypothetical protein